MNIEYGTEVKPKIHELDFNISIIFNYVIFYLLWGGPASRDHFHQNHHQTNHLKLTHQKTHWRWNLCHGFFQLLHPLKVNMVHLKLSHWKRRFRTWKTINFQVNQSLNCWGCKVFLEDFFRFKNNRHYPRDLLDSGALLAPQLVRNNHP